MDATGRPQSLLLLGGTSEIGLAVADAWAGRVPDLRVVLAARPGPRREEAAARLEGRGCRVEVLDFDALDDGAHERVVEQARAGGDVDVVTLGDPEQLIPAQNVVALARRGVLDDSARRALEQVASRLTTADLNDMNLRASGDEKAGADLIARDWLAAGPS